MNNVRVSKVRGRNILVIVGGFGMVKLLCSSLFGNS
jgi:hypothetical protein